MSTASIISEFLAPKKMAIAGVSRNPKSFSRQVFKELKIKGFDLLPVNPNTEIIEDTKCYHSINDVPEEIKNLLIMTPKSQTDNTLLEGINKGFKSIWIQQGSDTKQTQKILAENNFDNVIMKQCIFMFAEPHGFHKFHRAINKFIGFLPK